MARHHALAAALLLGVPSLLAAQSAQPLPQPQAALPVEGEIQYYHLNYVTGELTKDDPTDAQRAGVNSVSQISYDNTCASTFTLPLTPGQEAMDWGLKAAGLTTIVRSFQMFYATSVLDTSIGGPGASLDVAFFKSTTGFGARGPQVARFSFTGLPGSILGSATAYAVTVDLVGGGEFVLPDGTHGYSYCSFDTPATGPLIGSISSCPRGQADAYDIYNCPGGSYVGTFNFGGTPQATFRIKIEEDDGSLMASQNLEFGTGVNVNVLSAPTPPVLGTNWNPNYFDLAGALGGSSGGGVSTLVWFSGRLPDGLAVTTFGEILIDPTSALLFSHTVPIVAFEADHNVSVPATDLSTLDLGQVYVQGLRLSGGAPIRLSTMLEVVIGF